MTVHCCSRLSRASSSDKTQEKHQAHILIIIIIILPVLIGPFLRFIIHADLYRSFRVTALVQTRKRQGKVKSCEMKCLFKKRAGSKMNTCHQPMANRLDHLAGEKIHGYILKQMLDRLIFPLWQVKRVNFGL